MVPLSVWQVVHVGWWSIGCDVLFVGVLLVQVAEVEVSHGIDSLCVQHRVI